MSQYGQGGPTDEPGNGQQGQPNPFSRDGADDAGAGQSQEWPGYSASAPEPTRPYEPGYGAGYDVQRQQPDPYGQSQPDPTYGGYAQPTPPPYQPADIPPYGSTAPDPYAGYPPNPYEANPYAPSPYAPSPYTGGYASPYGAMPVQHPQAVTAMVLGIVGLVICPPAGIGGLVMGNRIRHEIDAQPGRYTGRGMATAGFVLGIISIFYLAFWVLAVIVGFASS